MLPFKSLELSFLLCRAGFLRYHHQVVPLLELGVVRVGNEISLVRWKTREICCTRWLFSTGSGRFDASNCCGGCNLSLQLALCFNRTVFEQDLIQDLVVRAFAILEEVFRTVAKLLTSDCLPQEGTKKDIVGYYNGLCLPQFLEHARYF